MKFNVSSLLKEGTGSTREHDIDDDITIDGARRHVAGHVRFDRTPDGVLVRAKLSGTMDAECSRCLAPLSYPVSVEFDEEYLPTVDVTTGAHVEAPEGEEDAYRIDARHALDLTEPIVQYWAMALPMAPVCRDDCRGICPECGQEIASEHTCAADAGDARWAKLRNLRLR